MLMIRVRGESRPNSFLPIYQSKSQFGTQGPSNSLVLDRDRLNSVRVVDSRKLASGLPVGEWMATENGEW